MAVPIEVHTPPVEDITLIQYTGNGFSSDVLCQAFPFVGLTPFSIMVKVST